MTIDGQVVSSFAIQDTLIPTALDNKRIQVDVAAQRWSSDFRGFASGAGTLRAGGVERLFGRA